MSKTIARWESKSGKHWITLYRDAYGYGYRGADCGGALGYGIDSDDAAVELIQKQVNTGRFQPDAAKTPMKRTI